MGVLLKGHKRKFLGNLVTQLLHTLAHVDTDCNNQVGYKMQFAVFHF